MATLVASVTLLLAAAVAPRAQVPADDAPAPGGASAPAAPSGTEREPAPADDGGLLGTIEVKAPPIEDQAPDASAFADVVPIRDQPAEIETLADVLDDAVGVQVRRFGGLGDFTTMSIRGSGAGQVGIFFDGIPLTRARSETVNLADLPLDQLERVEIYRGVSPLALPASALAGAVNLVSREPSDTPQASLLAGGGSFGTRKVTLAGSGKRGPWSGLLTATYLGSEGDFAFDDDNGTPLNPFDDERTDRENNAFDSLETLAKLRWALAPDTTLTGVQEVFLNDQGVPGIGAFQSDSASLRDLRSLSYLRAERRAIAGRALDGTSTGYFVYEKEAFRDVQGDIGVGSVSTRNQTYAGGLDNRLVWRLASHELEGRLDLAGEVFAPRDELAPDPNGPDQSRVRVGVALGDTAGFFEDRLLVQPSFRYEHLHDRFGGTIGPGGVIDEEAQSGDIDLYTPRLGLRWEALPWLALRGNAGRYARAPNFTELFGNRGSIIGNPDLKPEEGVNADAGFVVTQAALGPLTALRFEAGGFYSEIDDLIVLVQNSQRTSVPRNVAKARVVGAEAALAVRAFERVQLTANYTYQDARDESGIPARDGNQLPGRPAHALYLRPEYRLGPGRLYYELDFLATNFLDQANFREIGRRAVHVVGGSLRLPWAPIDLSLELRNFTDEQIEDVAGFPLPGRSLFGSVRYSWEGAA
jgi:iron complex outermembrane receptor protein